MQSNDGIPSGIPNGNNISSGGKTYDGISFDAVSDAPNDVISSVASASQPFGDWSGASTALGTSATSGAPTTPTPTPVTPITTTTPEPHQPPASTDYYPRESSWQPAGLQRAQRTSAKVLGGIAVILIAVVFTVVALDFLKPLVARVSNNTWSDVASSDSLGWVEFVDLLIPGIIIFIFAMIILGFLYSAIAHAVNEFRNRDNPDATQKEDFKDLGARIVLPQTDEIRTRSTRAMGDAYPLADAMSLRQSRSKFMTSIAWSIADAGPLRAAPGVIVDTVAVPAWYTRDTSDDTDDDHYRFHTYFVVVDFRDERGVGHRCWSNALLGFFRPGQHVTVYYYEYSPARVQPFLRVHDVADAQYPVNVRDHVSVLFSRLMAQWRDSPENGGSGDSSVSFKSGNFHGIPWTNTSVKSESSLWRQMFGSNDSNANVHADNVYSDSFLNRISGTAWGQTWHDGISWVGYSSTCTAARPMGSEFSYPHPLDGVRKWEIPYDDFTIGGYSDGETHETVKLRAFDSVVEDVAVVPLFNRRSWCGFGYMAQVRVHGKYEGLQVWAFGDPTRNDSYLGTDAQRLKSAPVSVGDSVRVVRRSDDVYVVMPKVAAL